MAGSTFTNMGTLTRGGTGVSDFGIAMTNSGHVTVNEGLLEFHSTVENTNTMTATGGATLQLDKAVNGTGALDIGTAGTVPVSDSGSAAASGWLKMPGCVSSTASTIRGSQRREFLAALAAGSPSEASRSRAVELTPRAI